MPAIGVVVRSWGKDTLTLSRYWHPIALVAKQQLGPLRTSRLSRSLALVNLNLVAEHLPSRNLVKGRLCIQDGLPNATLLNSSELSKRLLKCVSH